MLSIINSSSDVIFTTKVQDKDFIIKGDDGGAAITALTIDMSAAGQFHFKDGTAALPILSNAGDTDTGLFFSAADTMAFSAGGTSQFTMADGVIAPVTDSDVDLGTTSLRFKNAYIDSITGALTGNASTATTLANARTIAGQSFDGSANITIASTDLSNTSNITLNDASQTLTNKTLTTPTINQINATDFTLDASGDITLDADGADIIFKDGGTEIFKFYNSGGIANIKSSFFTKSLIFSKLLNVVHIVSNFVIPAALDLFKISSIF